MRTRRLARCGRCGQCLAACICDLLEPIPVQTKLLVLMHHLEARKTTNTGRLAELALGARTALWGDPLRGSPELPSGRVLLLFPSPGARLLARSDTGQDATLVTPDGSWPQARKIARRVEAACAGRVVLVRVEPPGKSGYTLRHTERAFALATFEAIAHALGVLEGEAGEAITRRALALFAEFVRRRSAFRQVSASG